MDSTEFGIGNFGLYYFLEMYFSLSHGQERSVEKTVAVNYSDEKLNLLVPGPSPKPRLKLRTSCSLGLIVVRVEIGEIVRRVLKNCKQLD
jgi:hypothetical protein